MSCKLERSTGDTPAPVDTHTDVYSDDEVPTVVVVVAASLAVLATVLYLWFGGGHVHFH